MREWAKIINNTTKEVRLGVGVNPAYYAGIGMQEMELEQSYNGRWYAQGYAPIKPQPTPAEQLSAYKAELAGIDSQAIRPLRAVAAGTASDFDREKLADLEASAEEIRRKIKELGA